MMQDKLECQTGNHSEGMSDSMPDQVQLAARLLGARGGSRRTPAQVAAAKRNALRGGRPSHGGPFRYRCHRDGTVSYGNGERWLAQRVTTVPRWVLQRYPFVAVHLRRFGHAVEA